MEHHAVSGWGGVEFAVVFHGDRADLTGRIERIRTEFRALAVTCERSAGVTIGIVSFADYDTVGQMFAAADSRLYELKRGGKPA
jgi:GGDEF domain-containing protein